MLSFPHYMLKHLETNGYRQVGNLTANDVFFKDGDKAIWICYLDMEITPEQIRRAFEFNGYILFVVDDKLIPQEIESREATPMWLRVLHGLYLGRVYTWNGRFLYGLHFDYDTGDISESAAIQPDGLMLIETGTWLRGWTGVYKLARFYDKAWWDVAQSEWYDRQKQNQQYDNPWAKQQSSSRQSYEQAQRTWSSQDWHKHWTPPGGQRYTYGGSQQKSYEDQQRAKGWRPSNESSPQQDFMREFNQCGNLAEVKAIFRKLALKFHPDLNPDEDTTETMQLLNAAYDQAVRKWS